MGPGVGGGGGRGGGTRGERAMSKPQGDRLREATTARCLKTGGRTTVQGRRGAGVAVFGIVSYINPKQISENPLFRNGSKTHFSEMGLAQLDIYERYT